MDHITTEEIQRDLSGYLHRVKAGESLVIFEADEPIAELKPIRSPLKSARPHGLAKGKVEVPDEFFEPLPEELLRAFEGR